MDIDLIRSAEQFHNRRRRNRVWKRLVSILGCVVVFCTTYALILPAITMEQETVCGLQEHQHTDSCYTRQTAKRPACTTQTIGVHTHTAQCADGSCGYADFVIHEHNSACYEDGRLVCTLPERKAHTHTTECYQIPTRVVGEHTHTDSCLTLQRGALTCGKAETEGHTHTEACYGQKQVLICTVPESDGHTHGEGCYDESGALICTEEESTGHHHGAECYQTEKALTCGLKEAQPHHHTDECYAWENQLTCGKEAGPIYEQGQPELICTKEEIKPHQHTSDCFDAAGNWICGQPEILSHTHTNACFETVTEDVLTCGQEEHTHSEECYPTNEMAQMEGYVAVMLLEEQDGESVPVTYADNLLEGVKLSGNNTTYNPATDTFQTQVRIEFQFTQKPAAGQTYTYTYPQGIAVPGNYVGKDLTLMDGNKVSGSYRFVKNENGTYTVQVKFNKDYIDGASNEVKGYVQFAGTFTKENMDDNGNIVVRGTDDSTILVHGNEIDYPKDSTESYNIDVSKSGTWVQDGDKLVYTVYVRTTKGTPNPISFKDAMTIPNGLTLGQPVVTMEKYVRHWYSQYYWVDETQGTPVNNLKYSAEGNTLTMSLNGLSSTKMGDHTDQEFYKITYTYPITDQTVEKVEPNNSVTVSARDETKGQTVTDSATSTVTVNKDFSYTIEKSGAIASDKPGYIKWTVTVNKNAQNLVGAKLTDDMLGLVQNAQDIKVSPSDGANINRGENNKITDITFSAVENGVNKNQYTITYYTPVEESWNGTTVENKATLDPDPGKQGDEKEADATVTVNGVQFDKSGSHNATTNKLDWVITVNSGNLDIAGATLTDDMFAALSENAFTIDPSNGCEFTKDENGKITGITFTAGADGKNTQSYTIKYSTAIPTDGSGTSVTNTATLTPGEGKPGTPIEKESEVALEEPKLAKEGNYDSYNGVINWTITVNDNGKNIAGAELTDAMLGQLVPGNITVKKDWQEVSSDSGEYAINKDENGKVTNIIFKAIGETGVNTNKYVVTYQTAALPEWSDRIVSNEAKLSLNGTPVTAEVTVPGSGSVAKSAGTGTVSEDGKTLTIPWTVTLNVPKGGLAAGTIIEDDVTRNQYNNTNTNQWMTSGQIRAWAANMTWTDTNDTPVGKTYTPLPENVTFLASDGNTYTCKQIQDYNSTAEEGQPDLNALTYTKFTISYPDGLVPPEGATKLTFTYSTTANLTNAGTGQNNFYNDIKVGGKETGAEYIYHKAGVTKTDGNGNTGTTQVSNEGALTWKVKAIVGAGNKKLTLVDTLPEGVTLESLQLTGWGNLNMALTVDGETISGTDSTNQYTVTGTYQDRVITLDIAPQTEGNTIQTGAEFTLSVNCQVTDAASQTEPKTLKNDVTMKLDDVEIGSSSQTQEWRYQKAEVVTKVVDKSGSWENESRILNYTVVLNPEGKDLLDGSDTLTLVDTMTYTNQVWLSYPFDGSIAYSIDASLIQSTVKLNRAEWSEEKKDWVAGETINNWSWTYEAKTSENSWEKNKAINTITGNGIPDETPLLFRYSYRISSNVPDEIDGKETSFQLQLTNKAELAGESDTNTTSGDEMVWKHSDVAAGVTTDKSYSFYKVEAGNYNVSLAGATFTVYRYDTTVENWAETSVRTYTTDASGSFKITRQEKDANGNVTFTYDPNTLYKVVETAPPEGYRLPDPVKTYYFYFRDAADAEHTLPSSLPDGAVDLSAESKSVYVENVKNTTEITVNKVWKNHDGSDANTSGKPPVTIQLYQKTTQGSSSGGGSGKTVSVSIEILKQQYGSSTSACTQDLNVECRSGSTFTFRVNTWGTPMLYVNGVLQEYKSSATGSYGETNTDYTYSVTVTGDTTVTGYANNDNESCVTYTYVEPEVRVDTESGETPVTPEGTPYGAPVTITATDDWSHTFTNLPLTGTDENGNTVNYYYYVVETPVTNYDVSYDNNSGIQSGAITVTNTATDNPEYVLPETGGGGTVGYTLGGFALTAGAALWLLCRRKRRREAV
ncbi:MAG: LPXTG cell wall anchor domain-containing protein [Clostridiales bacterium]|nr:LPXTG cell wall anchor domain-containing protein [Clostridiales bacterium]